MPTNRPQHCRRLAPGSRQSLRRKPGSSYSPPDGGEVAPSAAADLLQRIADRERRKSKVALAPEAKAKTAPAAQWVPGPAALMDESGASAAGAGATAAEA